MHLVCLSDVVCCVHKGARLLVSITSYQLVALLSMSAGNIYPLRIGLGLKGYVQVNNLPVFYQWIIHTFREYINLIGLA